MNKDITQMTLRKLNKELKAINFHLEFFSFRKEDIEYKIELEKEIKRRKELIK